MVVKITLFLFIFTINIPPLNSLLDILNLNLSIILLNVFLFLILFLSLIFERKKIINKYFYFLFFISLSLITITLLNNDYDLIQNFKLFYLRVYWPIIIMFSIYFSIKYYRISYLLKKSIQLYIPLALLYLIIFFLQGYSIGQRPEGVLAISDGLAFLSIYNISFSSSKKNKILIYILTNILLFFYLSMTSIVFYNITMFLYFFIKNISRKNVFKKIIFIFIFISLLVFLFILLFNLSEDSVAINGDGELVNLINLLLNRIHLILNFEDISLNQRIIQFEEGLTLLSEKPFMGEFLYTLRVFGTTGSYMHNLLSFWAAYGLGIFLAVFILYIYFLYNNFIKYIRYDNLEAKSIFFSAIFILLLMIFSRSYTTMLFWVMFSILFLSQVNIKRLKNEY